MDFFSTIFNKQDLRWVSLYALTLAQELSDVFDKLNDIGVRFGPISILSNEISHEALEILFPTIQIAPVHYYVLTPLSIQKQKHISILSNGSHNRKS